jgi:endonuclease YncB( thermonuclease family)
MDRRYALAAKLAVAAAWLIATTATPSSAAYAASRQAEPPETAAAAGRLPWKEGDPAPPLAGVRLGDTRETVERVLGRPDRSEQTVEDLWEMEYSRLGLQVKGSPRYGVQVVLAGKRGAGELGGFRVGDPAADVLQRWGEPDTGGLGALVYYVGKWQLAVQEDMEGRIVVFGIALRLDAEPSAAESAETEEPPQPSATTSPAAPPGTPPAAAAPTLPAGKSFKPGQAYDFPPGTLEVFNGQFVGQTRPDGERFPIRVAGIVAPIASLAGWREAHATLEELLAGRNVRLEIIHVARAEGIHLPTARVLADGSDVALAMIRSGWALACRDPCDDAALMALETEARAARRGLWGLKEGEAAQPENMLGFWLYACRCPKSR